MQYLLMIIVELATEIHKTNLGMCELLGIKLVGVPSEPETHNLDLEAIERAITPRTKVILVNSPNNPTGAIYDNATLQSLGRLLDKKNKERESPIVLISDEVTGLDRPKIFIDSPYFLPVSFRPTVELYLTMTSRPAQSGLTTPLS